MELLSFLISILTFPVLFTNVFGMSILHLSWLHERALISHLIWWVPFVPIGFRLVGLTGGISTGKSTVTRTLKNLGIPVIDFDLISREIVAPNSSCLNALVKEFGNEILNPDGTLDRAKLGSIIFSDASKRKRLNEIMRRPILYRFFWLLLQFFFLGNIPVKAANPETQTARDEGPLSPSHGILSTKLYHGLDQAFNGTKVVVLDCPLLFESGISSLCSSTVFVNCDDDVQLDRLMKRDNITKTQAQAKIDAQWGKDKKSKLATHIIENNTTPDQLYANICAWWKKVTEDEFGIYLIQPHQSYDRKMANLVKSQRLVQDQFDIYVKQVESYQQQQYKIARLNASPDPTQSLPSNEALLLIPTPPKYSSSEVFPDVTDLVNKKTMPSFWQVYQPSSFCLKPTILSLLFTGILAIPSYFIIQWLEHKWFTPTKQ